jgi:hypothetical protein
MWVRAGRCGCKWVQVGRCGCTCGQAGISFHVDAVSSILTMMVAGGSVLTAGGTVRATLARQT